MQYGQLHLQVGGRTALAHALYYVHRILGWGFKIGGRGIGWGGGGPGGAGGVQWTIKKLKKLKHVLHKNKKTPYVLKGPYEKQ